jgi:hypothetical protein
MDNRLTNLKKPALIVLAVLVTAYLGLFMYFSTHFYYGTIINGIDVSFKTVAEANDLMLSKIASYTLELEGRGELKEQLSAEDIGLKFESSDKVLLLKENQKKSEWFLSLFSQENKVLKDALTYDEDLLKASVQKLAYLDPKNVEDPVDATLTYVAGSGYEVIEEKNGSRVKHDILYSSLEKAILNEERMLNLETVEAYEMPVVTSTSDKLQKAKTLVDRYMQAKVTYEHSGGSEVVDGNLISKWLVISDSFDVSFDQEAIRAYVTELASHYNTYKTTRTFKSSLGTTATVKGGDYGWRVDVADETAFLKETIEAGRTVEREPDYLQKAASRGSKDFGNTYLEINITKQHVWYYKNGNLITHGDIVTGNIAEKNNTPTGVYLLKYKKKDAILRGADYASEVSYWMPFNGDVGFHDAPWRTKFGGDIYLTNGSHGCVNAPFSVAQTVFNNITPGTPVVVYR